MHSQDAKTRSCYSWELLKWWSFFHRCLEAQLVRALVPSLRAPQRWAGTSPATCQQNKLTVQFKQWSSSSQTEYHQTELQPLTHGSAQLAAHDTSTRGSPSPCTSFRKAFTNLSQISYLNLFTWNILKIFQYFQGWVSPHRIYHNSDQSNLLHKE